MHQDRIVRTIESYRRLKSSRMGNPRYEITFTDGSVLETFHNAGFAYEIGNQGMRVGSRVVLEVTSAGRIASMSGVES